jgi:hypothetical protein
MLGVHFNLLDTTVLPFHVLPPFVFSIKLEHIVIGACRLVVSHITWTSYCCRGMDKLDDQLPQSERCPKDK